MKVMAYDIYKNPDLNFVEYTDLDTVLEKSDLISLHCPLTDDSYHMINKKTIKKMKDNVVLVNTSRGALIDTQDLIQGIREHKFHSVGLDVYEEETKNVFENREDDILETSITSRLLSFPNVIEKLAGNEVIRISEVAKFCSAYIINEHRHRCHKRCKNFIIG